MDWRERLHSDEKVLLGKPVIKGTRISVELIVELLASGWTEEKILKNYPRLKQKDLQAIFSYLHECMQDGLLYEEHRRPA